MVYKPFKNELFTLNHKIIVNCLKNKLLIQYFFGQSNSMKNFTVVRIN